MNLYVPNESIDGIQRYLLARKLGFHHFNIYRPMFVLLKGHLQPTSSFPTVSLSETFNSSAQDSDIFLDMREILKDREHSFTEMAKCVGEKWQELPPDERERFERQASTVKEKYLAELAEYKKTENYRLYQEYLADFKAKNGKVENVNGRFCFPPNMSRTCVLMVSW